MRLGTLYSLVALAMVVTPQAPEHPFNQRPADATAVISGSHGLYDGTFTFSQIANVCGEVPADLNFAGVPSFIIQFPDGGDGEIQDVTFGSTALVGAVTTATKFHLSVAVKSPRIGSPYAYVLDTERPKMTGLATRSSPEPGTTRLKVAGTNDRGESIDFVMTCRPRKS